MLTYLTRRVGSDAVVEESNKAIKQCITGHPTEHMWRNVTRNIDNLAAIRCNTSKMLGFPAASDTAGARPSMEADILAVRTVLRANRTLESSNTNLLSLDGRPLDESLFCMEEYGRTNAVLLCRCEIIQNYIFCEETYVPGADLTLRWTTISQPAIFVRYM